MAEYNNRVKYFSGDKAIVLLVRSNPAAVIKVNGKVAGICRGGTLKLSLPSRYTYFVEAVYLSAGGVNYCPAAVALYPENPVFECGCANLTRYSYQTFMLEFFAKNFVSSGIFEPKEQIKYKQGDILHTATLYYDNFYYIELENEESIIKKRIAPEVTDVNLSCENVGGNILAAYGNCGENKYALFIGCADDYRVLGEYTCGGCRFEKNKLIISNTKKDMMGHCEEIIMDCTPEGFKQTEKKVWALRKAAQFDELIPYYFLEAVLSENYTEALAYLDKANYDGITPVQLKNFFGRFSDVVQNIYDEKYAPFVAIKKHISKSYYELHYFDFKIKDGIIENIINADF